MSKLIKGVNDLQTKYPELMKDWDWELNTRLPDTLLPSSRYYADWVCHKCGHRWKSRLDSRTKCFHGCPKCNPGKGSSMPDYLLYYLLKSSLNTEVLYRYNLLPGKEADVCIPELRLVIEYNGYSFHFDEEAKIRDFKKVSEFKSFGFSVFTFQERNDYEKVFSIEENICYLPSISYNEFEFLKQVYIRALKNLVILQQESEDFKKISLQEITNITSAPKYDNSLEYVLNNRSNCTLNWSKENKKSASSVYSGSRELVKITCNNGHTFETEARYLLRNYGCPVCSGREKTTDDL